MRIALFHNRYHFRGGEDVVVDFEQDLLESLGFEVHRMEVANDDVFSPPRFAAAYALWRAPWNPRSQRRVRKFLQQTGCELGHVHNWFPLLSPSIYTAHRDLGLPVVQTLHNYRLVCANGTFQRDGGLCQLCVDGKRDRAVKHGCYRDSRTLSQVWKRVMDAGWAERYFQEQVSLFLAPTQYVADTHIQLGLPTEKVRVLPHGVPDPGRSTKSPDPANGALFIGRLSHEKGLDVLLETWRDMEHPLTIIGVGPEEERLKAAMAKHPSIRWIPRCDRTEIYERLQESALLVSPHRNPEAFGLTVVEAMACARGVVGSDLGGPGELILNGEGGQLVPAEDPKALRAAVETAMADPELLARWGEAARAQYEARYSPEAHGRALVAAFEELVRGKAERAA